MEDQQAAGQPTKPPLIDLLRRQGKHGEYLNHYLDQYI